MRAIEPSEALYGLGNSVARHGLAPSTLFAGRNQRRALGPEVEGGPSYRHVNVAQNRTPVVALFRANSQLDMRTCGQPGSPPCDTGNAVSTLGGLGGLGRTLPGFCNPVRVLLDELQALMQSAGYGALPEATKTSVKSIYDDIGGKVAYVGFLGNDCERDADELTRTIAEVRGQLGTNAPAPLRPDWGNLPEATGTSVWLKALVIGGVSVAGLVAIGYAVRSFR